MQCSGKRKARSAHRLAEHCVHRQRRTFGAYWPPVSLAPLQPDFPLHLPVPHPSFSCTSPPTHSLCPWCLPTPFSPCQPPPLPFEQSRLSVRHLPCVVCWTMLLLLLLHQQQHVGLPVRSLFVPFAHERHPRRPTAPPLPLTQHLILGSHRRAPCPTGQLS